MSATVARTGPTDSRRRLLGGGGVAFLVTLPLMACPLWVQFFGRLHTSRVPFAMEYFGVDLATILPFSPLSIAGKPESSLYPLSSGPSEYNTYFGWSVLLACGLCLVWMWSKGRHRVPLVAIALTGFVMLYIALGVNVSHALELIPLMAIVFALTLDTTARSEHRLRATAPLLVVAALMPTIPAQIPTETRAPVPVFITSGDWRQCAPEGGVIVPVPLPTPTQPDLMRWAAAANQAFGIPRTPAVPSGPRSATGAMAPRSLKCRVASSSAVTSLRPTATRPVRCLRKAEPPRRRHGARSECALFGRCSAARSNGDRRLAAVAPPSPVRAHLGRAIGTARPAAAVTTCQPVMESSVTCMEGTGSGAPWAEQEHPAAPDHPGAAGRLMVAPDQARQVEASEEACPRTSPCAPPP